MGRAFRWGRVRPALLLCCALALAFAPAPAARADFDCGTALMRCQVQLDDSGRAWFDSYEKLTEDALGDGTLQHGISQVYERVGNETVLISRLPDGTPIPPGKWQTSAYLRGVSADGRRVYMDTEASLVPADQNGGHEMASTDGYLLSDGSYTLLTTGPGDSGQAGAQGASILWASNDGSYVYFLSDRQLVPEDWDSRPDIYQRHDGVTRLVSTGPDEFLPTTEWPEPFVPEARFLGATPDGSTAYFTTAQHLTADDPGRSPGEGWRLTSDVFAWRDGVTTRLTHTVSPQEVPGTPDEAFDPSGFAGAAADGSVYFVANSGQVPEDTDLNPDVYRARPDGTLERVFASGVEGNGTLLRVEAVSADGSRLFLFTNRQLLPADRDDQNDIYLWSGGKYQLVSPDSGVSGLDEELSLCSISGDGRRAYFQTWAALTPQDTDEEPDVYEWSDGSVRLVSPSADGKQSASFCMGISPNGRFVAFATWEELLPGDEDHKEDIYVVDMGAPQAGAATTAAARPKPARRHRRLRLITAESIAPRMSVGRVAQTRRGKLRLRLRCPKAERSGPCHGHVRLLTPKSHRLLAKGSFRIVAGHGAAVTLSARKLPRARWLLVRVSGADMLGNRRMVSALVRLRRS